MGVITGLRRAGRGNSFLALSASFAALMMGGVVMPTLAYAQVAQRQIDVDIPAQDLNSALLILTQRAGLQIVYDADKVAGRRSTAIKGRLAPVEALSRLLTGTGLTFRITGNNRIVVEPAPQTADGSVQLGPVRVEGANGNGSALLGTSVSDPTITEGTRSYAAAATSVGSKTAQSLREAPQTVSVITSQRMEDQGLSDIYAVLDQTTGMTKFQGSMLDARFLSRGFAVDNARLDGGASTQPFQMTTDIDMAFYDHVEILRGADGLLGAAGEPGASLNLVRKKPTAETQLIGTLRAGSWNNYRAEGDISGPVAFNGAVRARLVAAYEDRKYFYDVAYSKRTLLYGIVEADVTPTTLVTVGATYDHRDSSIQSYGLPRLMTGEDAALPRSTFLSGADTQRNREGYSLFGRIEQKIGSDWKLRADINHMHWKQFRYVWNFSGAIDPETGGGVGAGFSNIRDRQTVTSADVSLTGTFELFGASHKLLVGGDLREISQPTVTYSGVSGYLEIPNIYQFKPSDYPNDTLLTTASAHNTQVNKDYGVYASLKVTLAEPLKVIAGGRLNWTRYSYQTLSNLTKRQNNGVFTPYGALLYDFAKDWTVYASAAQTFKSQSGSLAGPLPGTPLKPITGSNFEVGVKGELADGRLNASFALYRIDRNGQAVRDPAYPPTSGDFGASCCYVDSGRIRSQGVDTEISGEILPGWQMTVGYTYNDNRNRMAGQRYETLTPKHLLKLFTSYRFNGTLEGLALGGGVQVQSTSSVRDYAYLRDSSGNLTGDTIDAEFSRKAYAIANLFGSYALNDNWTVSANVNNLFDKRYYSTIGYLDYGNFYGDPRNFLVTLRAKY